MQGQLQSTKEEEEEEEDITGTADGMIKLVGGLVVLIYQAAVTSWERTLHLSNISPVADQVCQESGIIGYKILREVVANPLEQLHNRDPVHLHGAPIQHKRFGLDSMTIDVRASCNHQFISSIKIVVM